MVMKYSTHLVGYLMEPTIDQALQQGVAAHKEGKLQEAERLYRAILQVNSKHPDANHNLGILAISVNKVEMALPLFKTAVEANPNVEQFWLSYIQVLIRLHMLDHAREEFKKCKEIGHKSDEVERLKNRLDPSHFRQSVIFAVEQFYQNITKRVISDASLGWFFVDSFDKHFNEVKPLNEVSKKEKYSLKNKSAEPTNDQNLLQLDPAQTIEKLNYDKEILRARVEQSIESAISETAKNENLDILWGFIFPPVDIKLGSPPGIMVTSLKDELKLTNSKIVTGQLTSSQRDEIEAKFESLENGLETRVSLDLYEFAHICRLIDGPEVLLSCAALCRPSLVRFP